MESVFQALSQTTPTGWIISTLLAIVVYFLQRFIKSIDEMKTDVGKIATAMVEHKTIVDEHDRRIERIEEKLF